MACPTPCDSGHRWVRPGFGQRTRSISFSQSRSSSCRPPTSRLAARKRQTASGSRGRACRPGDRPRTEASRRRTSSRLRPFGTVSSAMNRGAMIPAARPGSAPAARFGKQEECPKTLRVIVYRSAVPGSPPVLCRNGIVDVGHPDGVQRNAASRPASRRSGRRRGSSLVWSPSERPRSSRSHRLKGLRPLRDADGALFGFVEPAQKSAAIELRD